MYKSYMREVAQNNQRYPQGKRQTHDPTHFWNTRPPLLECMPHEQTGLSGSPVPHDGLGFPGSHLL